MSQHHPASQSLGSLYAASVGLPKSCSLCISWPSASTGTTHGCAALRVCLSGHFRFLVLESPVAESERPQQGAHTVVKVAGEEKDIATRQSKEGEP